MLDSVPLWLLISGVALLCFLVVMGTIFAFVVGIASHRQGLRERQMQFRDEDG